MTEPDERERDVGPTIYPDIERIRAMQRNPGSTIEDIRAEYMRQVHVIIPLLKRDGRIEEWVFWAGFVAFCGPASRKRARKR